MAMTQYTASVEIITNLGTTPTERGLTTDQFKAKFDEGLKGFAEWFNDTHLGELNEHLASTEWIAPTLLNGWVNYGGGLATAGYRKDTHGYVRIKGNIKNGTTATNTVLFTLPEGYRPLEHRYFAVYNGTSAANVVVYSTGDVCIISGSAAGLGLDNIVFETT